MLWKVILFLIIIAFMYYRWTKRKIVQYGKQFKNDYPCLPIIGHAYQFISSEACIAAIDKHGREALKNDGVTGVWLGYKLCVVFAEPTQSEWLLRTCLEKSDEFRISRTLIGDSLPVASVPIWRPHRKLFTPSFTPRHLNQFVDIFAKQSTVLADQLMTLGKTGPFQMWRYIIRYTMDTLLETNLGVRSQTEQKGNHPLLLALRPAGPLLAARMLQPWLNKDSVYRLTPAHSQFVKHKNAVYSIVEQIIQSKKEDMKNKQTQGLQVLLESLLKSSSNGEYYTKEELEGEILGLFIAGVDTSATALGLTLKMLARHQDVQDKVLDELDKIFGTSNRLVTNEDLPKLKYLEAVIKETMRLYPPAPIIARKVEEDLVTPTGLHLLKGITLTVNIWALHRNQQYWGADADQFRPERFLDTPFIHPAQYMPFSYGPRNCVGSTYAMMSIKTALTTLLRRCRVLPAHAQNGNANKHAPLRVRFDVVIKDVERIKLQLQDRKAQLL